MPAPDIRRFFQPITFRAKAVDVQAGQTHHNGQNCQNLQNFKMDQDLPARKRRKVTPETRQTPAESPEDNSSDDVFFLAPENPEMVSTSADGVRVVPSSDAEDSDEELADLDSFVPKSRPVAAVQPSMRRSTRICAKTTEPSHLPSPPPTVYKHSLASMIKATRMHSEQEARIAQAEAAVAESEKMRLEESLGDDVMDLTFMEAEDSDERSRVRAAMSRTEALQGGDMLCFFTRPVERVAPYDFPAASLPQNKAWAKLMSQDESRERLCLTGFVTKLASSHLIPDELLSWFAHRLLYEPRCELCDAYVEIIQAASFQAIDLTTFYHTRYSDPSPTLPAWKNHLIQTVNSTDESKPRKRAPRFPIPGLEYILRLLPPTSPHKVLIQLLLSLLDINTKPLTSAISTTIERMTSTHPSSSAESFAHEVLSTLLPETDIPAIPVSMHQQCALTLSLPCGNVVAHTLRRRLALYTVTQIHSSSISLGNAEWFEILVEQLGVGSAFKVSGETDFSLLEKLVVVLDVAVDGGFADFKPEKGGVPAREGAERASPNATEGATPGSERTPPNVEAERSKGIFAIMRQKQPLESGLFATREEEEAFNTHVDSLVTQLRITASRLRYGPGVHLNRWETQWKMDNLISRWECAVRTRGKKGRKVF
ncbi:hypothetical protein K470DRAFT_276711 [Piedraia hortae CBS 480.64]|uniref:Uncharacterized protein n=1 Tax=Piedraia hortae CBS 480.64 TaxID=1314780 RepID=A0A6A7C1F4_9PEZI|nr:hypothetical protein K470DRAFT_276711 [Piedraia hortae CBS 480.64]